VIWRELEAQAPELAAAGRDLFERFGVALLGSTRPDGSARISPVGPYFLEGHLVFGIMRSPKGDDLQRDPRCVLHSAVRDGDGSDGEFKVYGRAVETHDPAIVDSESGWWHGRPRERYRIYSMDIEEADLVAWDWTAERMRLTRWSAGPGVQQAERTQL
jgi:hypothetical protein